MTMSKAQKMKAVRTDRRTKMTWRRFRRYIPIYLIMLPGLVYLFINNYMPLPGLIVAFKQVSIRVTGLDSKILNTCSRQTMPG